MKKINFLIKYNNITKTTKKYKNINKTISFETKKAPSMKFNEQIVNNSSMKNLSGTITKKIFDWWLTLIISSQEANLLPPIGPYLGQHGFNTMLFVNTFNDLTTEFQKGVPLKIIMKLFSDKSILFSIKPTPSSFLLYSVVKDGKITIKDLIKISLIKKIELINVSLIAIAHSVIGTANSMNIKILY